MIVQCNKTQCRFYSNKEQCKHGVVHELEGTCHRKCTVYPEAECMEV